MADSGVYGVVAGGTKVSSTRRRASAPPAEIQTSASSGQSGAGFGAPKASYTAPGQVLNIDGQSFDRTAPRGTYLNILA
jgi:hypothetical protein